MKKKGIPQDVWLRDVEERLITSPDRLRSWGWSAIDPKKGQTERDEPTNPELAQRRGRPLTNATLLCPVLLLHASAKRRGLPQEPL